eukprot:gene15103-21157_t
MITDPCSACNAAYCPEGNCVWNLASVSCYGLSIADADLYLVGGYDVPVAGVFPAWCFNMYTQTSYNTTLQAICHL